tara:strand:- start:7 stop:879 length:873 start_codon:yes stop_codon:yes gene_type:complete
MNTNPQIYKTIGSLIFHKYEQLHSTSFRCNEIIEYQDTDYAFFSSITNNNNSLSQLSTISISNDNMCLIIDNKSCYSNRLYYHNIVRHIFMNTGTFYANDVYNLSEYIIKFPFNLILANRLLSTIYLQHQLLLESGYSISYIDPEDILVICTQEEGDDGTLFFFSNYEKIYKINTNMEGGECDSNDSIRVIHFYDHDNLFLPPELIENIDIPFTCHKSSWFYSLACVVLYCLNPDKINDGFGMDRNSCENTISKHDYMINQLCEYNGTKLYYTLLYCLSKEPCNREFILF